MTVSKLRAFWKLTIHSARDAVELYFDPLWEFYQWVLYSGHERAGQHFTKSTSAE
jgi:hypothetical protein